MLLALSGTFEILKNEKVRKLKTRTVKGEKSEEYIKVPKHRICVGVVGDEPTVLHAGG